MYVTMCKVHVCDIVCAGVAGVGFILGVNSSLPVNTQYMYLCVHYMYLCIQYVYLYAQYMYLCVQYMYFMCTVHVFMCTVHVFMCTVHVCDIVCTSMAGVGSMLSVTLYSNTCIFGGNNSMPCWESRSLCLAPYWWPDTVTLNVPINCD